MASKRNSDSTGDALGTREQRIAIWNVCKYRCPVCRVKMVVGGNKRTGLTIDHLEAFAAGGANDAGNLYPLCGSCNSSKCDAPLAVWLPARLVERGRCRTAGGAVRTARQITKNIHTLVASYATILEG